MKATSDNKPRVTVLMSTWNGEKYLREQIDSILAQQGVEVRLVVRDDGSSDATHDILQEYAAKGLLEWSAGENLKPALSFMELVYNSPESDFYAFSDQDDVWDDDKLISAVDMLEEFDSSRPSLYISATRVVDENLRTISIDRREKFRLTFGEALFRNPATGCTQVFNRSMRDLLITYRPEFIIMHDAWLYCLCLAVDGNLVFDPEPHISYRQHGGNVIGAARSTFVKRFKRRINASRKSATHEKIRQFSQLREGFGKYMTDPSKIKILDNLLNYRQSIASKLFILTCRDVTTNSADGRIAMFMMVLLNKY